MALRYGSRRYSRRARLPFPAALILAVVIGVAVAPAISSVSVSDLLPPIAPGSGTVTARFDLCAGPQRVTCVVDGDTIWLSGEKIRIADINTPETYQPSCAEEAALGRRATQRMAELLNAGPITVRSWDDRDVDRYGRALRVIERDGRSLGQVLVAEGLAHRWEGYMRDWC